AAALMRCYDWPGNVRELNNVVEHALVLVQGEEISPAELPMSLHESNSKPAPAPAGRTLRDAQRQVIMEALKQSRNCKAVASRLLGINVRRLNRLIVKCAVPDS